jgi:hypothetical protein
MKDATKKHQTRFNKLRAKYQAITTARDEFRSTLAAHYGVNFQRSWLKPSEQRKLAAFAARADMVEEDFFTLLDAISPRSWRSIVAVSWIMESLTFADAVTAGAITAEPTGGYGATLADLNRFCRPVSQSN